MTVPEPSKRKSFLFAVITNVFILLLIEGGLRLAGFEYHNIPRYIQFADDKYKFPEASQADFDFVFDAEIFWRLKPNNPRFSTNSYGYRYEEFSEKKPAGVYRIIAMGGSCTFGLRAPFAYSLALEKILNQNRSGTKYEVINTGVPGYTSLQGLKLLESELLAYGPDLILVYFGWNDHWLARFYEDKDQVVPSESLQEFLDAISRWRIVQGMTYIVTSIRSAVMRPPDTKAFRVVPADYEANLKRIVERAGEAGVRVVFITAPMAYTSGADVPDYLLRDGFILEKSSVPATHAGYNDILRRAAEASGALVADAAAVFDRMPDKRTLFFRDGIHPKRVGHLLIAELLFRTMVSAGLVPEEEYDMDVVQQEIARLGQGPKRGGGRPAGDGPPAL